MTAQVQMIARFDGHAVVGRGFWHFLEDNAELVQLGSYSIRRRH